MRNWLGNIFKQGGARVFPWLWESLCQENENINCFHGVFLCVFPQIGVMDVSWKDKKLPPTPDSHKQHWAPVCRKHQERINSCSKWGDFYCSVRQRTLYREMTNCDVLWWNGVSLTSAYMLPVPVRPRTFMLWRMALPHIHWQWCFAATVQQFALHMCIRVFLWSNHGNWRDFNSMPVHKERIVLDVKSMARRSICLGSICY